MRAELKELWRFRELLQSLVEREMRIRYKNSVLGFFWSLINPLVTVAVMTLVFKYFLQMSVGSYVLYVLAAYLPFTFFQFALMDSAQSVLSALPMVKKVYFPREVLPLAQIIANFIHFLLAMLVFMLVATLVWIKNPGQYPIRPTAIWVPFIMVAHLALVTGLGLIISALNTFYEDIKYILAALLYILFFLTPVMYFSENVHQALMRKGALGQVLYNLYHLNPMAVFCTAYRKLLLAPTPVPINGKPYEALPLDLAQIFTAVGMSVLILLYGYHLFNKLKWKFVERP